MEPPLSVKATMRHEGLELLLVGSAASLLEGDELSIDIRVSGPVPLVVRSVAAQVAHPCPSGGSTSQHIRLDLVDGARLLWGVEPLIVAGGARHHNTLAVEVDTTSRAVVVDSVLLGRTNEDPTTASLCAEMTCRAGGAVLLEDGMDTTLPACFGPAGLNGNRFVSSVVALGWRPSTVPAGALSLVGEGMLVRSLSVQAASAGLSAADTAHEWWVEGTSRQSA